MHRKASYLIAEDGVIFFNVANLRADEILRHINGMHASYVCLFSLNFFIAEKQIKNCCVYGFGLFARSHAYPRR